MNLGYELNNNVLQEGKISSLLESGLNRNWLTSIGTGSEVVFTGIDKQVYQWLLDYWKRHHRVPSIPIFREHFPENVYHLHDDYATVDELLDLTTEKVNSYLIADLLGRTIDLHDEGRIDTAIALLKAESDRLGTELRFRKTKADNLSDLEFDIEEFLDRNIQMGVPFGVYKIDEGFYGFQPGMLVTIMGRQKSGKTTLTLNSALNAWKEGYTVLYFSVEMDVDMLRQRLYALGAHVSPSRMRRGHLRPSEKEKLRDFHHQLVNAEDEEEGRFFISKKKSLITIDDVLEEVRLYNPNVVYIDGFNFMMDRHTHKLTIDWQANENVANELKTVALEEQVAIVTNTQVQEKQYHPKFGIEARTIASGTGLLKASDLIIGLDKQGNTHTVNCVLSRFEEFEETVLELDWDTMTLTVIEEPSVNISGKGI